MKDVLIASSDYLLADGIKKFLRSFYITCELAHDISEANRYLQSGQFGVIVIDLEFCGSSGLSFLHLLRRSGNSAPVIFLTFKADWEELMPDDASGTNVFLCKLADIYDLLKRVRSLLEMNAVSSGQFQCGNLILNERTKLVSANGRQFTISPHEWAILKFMVCNAGKVVSKQQLADKFCFSEHSANALNRVEFYISRIRPRLVGSNTHIRTIRGFGYLMEVISRAD